MRRNRALVLLILLSIAFTIQSFSQNILITSNGVLGARALGMGSAFTAVALDGSAFIYNPAGVAYEKSFVLNGLYSSLHGSIGTPLGNLTWGGLTVPQSEFSLSANWVRFQSADQHNYPDISGSGLDLNERELLVRQNRAQSFSTQYEDAYSLSFARKNILNIDWGWNQYILPIEIPVGVTVRYTHASLAFLTAKAWSVDAGVMLRMNLRDMFFSDDYPYICFGYTLKNLGGSVMTWQSGEQDYFGLHSTYGFAIIQPLESLESEATLAYDRDSRTAAPSRIGLEWKYRKYFFVRSGFFSNTFTMGIGADLRFFLIDYAYQFSSQTLLGDAHHLNIAFRLERLFL